MKNSPLLADSDSTMAFVFRQPSHYGHSEPRFVSMQQSAQHGRLVPASCNRLRLAVSSRPAVPRHRNLATTTCGYKLDPSIETVPQKVSAALRSRRDAVKGLQTKLRDTDASQQVVTEVVQEFQGLHEQVQQLAAHLEALDNKAQAKAVEKAAKKERKEAEKALKKEQKAAEKAASGVIATQGFNDGPKKEYRQELNNMVVSTVAGDIGFDTAQLGRDVPDLTGQTASSRPASTVAIPAAATVSVCQGKDCMKQGAGKLLQYVVSTAGPEIDVVPCKCLGKCEQAPNVRVQVPEQKSVLHTQIQSGEEVRNIIERTKAEYSDNVMKSFAMSN